MHSLYSSVGLHLENDTSGSLVGLCSLLNAESFNMLLWKKQKQKQPKTQQEKVFVSDVHHLTEFWNLNSVSGRAKIQNTQVTMSFSIKFLQLWKDVKSMCWSLFILFTQQREKQTSFINLLVTVQNTA